MRAGFTESDREELDTASHDGDILAVEILDYNILTMELIQI